MRGGDHRGEDKWFHTHVAKILYLAKRVKPECLTAVAFLSTRVTKSDTVSQAIHLRNLIVAQRYDLSLELIYQDNMSCMALIKRGGPGSERSRHINIRHFWLSEKVAQKEVTLKHLSTEDMFANILTKPVQGAQFERERLGLTNWKA